METKKTVTVKELVETTNRLHEGVILNPEDLEIKESGFGRSVYVVVLTSDGQHHICYLQPNYRIRETLYSFTDKKNALEQAKKMNAARIQ